ncbi:voltage-gated monoatomic cation channel TMEM109 [Gouania willdenowi]|uniref:Uncharacterized LOC114461297 n=1 Tax=Gouania willdenowi TaxID=441366 RepID=A0A8C5FXT5_GOUWI|nr:uncharacterized protein LOC114461297 [Gouania willdenowi]
MLFSGALWLITAGLLLSVRAEKGSEDRDGFFQQLWSSVELLGRQGRTYLDRLAGEQTVLSVQKAFSQVLSGVAKSLAIGLNVLLQYTSQLLKAAGLHVRVPASRVTAEGVIFVAQWVLVVVIGYWLLSHMLRLVASTLRCVLWLVKVGLALACFVFILSDYRVGTETMALRLAALVFVCVLFGVSFGGGAPNTADKTARLEEQVKLLEKRLRDMERWTSRED